MLLAREQSINRVIVSPTYGGINYNVKYCKKFVTTPFFACPFEDPTWQMSLARSLKETGFSYRQVEAILNGVAKKQCGLLRLVGKKWGVLPIHLIDVSRYERYNCRGDASAEETVEQALPPDHWWHSIDDDDVDEEDKVEDKVVV